MAGSGRTYPDMSGAPAPKRVSWGDGDDEAGFDSVALDESLSLGASTPVSEAVALLMECA